MRSKLIMAAAVLGSGLLLASAPAQARYWHHGGHWHHGGRGWGWGAGAAGFAAGALIGGALAQPYYYGGPAYAYEPPYAGDDAEAYCEQRFRSYDPASGTYLGYDGRRHPCP